jgi:hypothetical protein
MTLILSVVINQKRTNPSLLWVGHNEHRDIRESVHNAGVDVLYDRVSSTAPFTGKGIL